MRLQPTNVEAYSSLARVVSYEALSPLARRLAAWAFAAAHWLSRQIIWKRGTASANT